MNDDVVRQLEELQAPEEVIEAARRKLKPPDSHFHVWEENWPVVVLFSELATQWRVQVGMSSVVYFGLDYPSVESVMNVQRIPRAARAELLHGLRVMENAALPLLNKND